MGRGANRVNYELRLGGMAGVSEGPTSQSSVGPARPGRSLGSVRRPTSRRHNVPHLPSSFIGRDAEVAEVAALLARTRLVTLTGPGGMGKTRLSVEVAMRLVPEFVDGTWLVELAHLSEPALLPEAVAAVLLGTQQPGPRTVEQLALQVGDQQTLLVLDNCEHLVEPCAQLVDVLLRCCPCLTVLATSREPLGVPGEHRWSVGALSLPDRDADAETVRKSEAGELFLQRAREHVPGFELSDSAAATVAQICARLDGMPLALELAAARLASLSPADVLDRLDDRFGLLATRSRTVVPRHQTLAATLEWSHDLLSAAEAALLRRVSVFSGWTLAAAQAVCTGGEVERNEVLDLLGDLVSKSLVTVDTPDGHVRYSLLSTVKGWARAKLVDAAEADEVARRHAGWCLVMAEQADEGLRGGQPQLALNRLEIEHGNVRAALEWARATGETETGLRLAAAVATFWRTRGHLQEASAWLEWALTGSEGHPVLLRARVMRQAGMLRGMLGDMTTALPLLEESSILFAAAGDHDASVCACSSIVHMFRNPRQSLPRLEADVERCRATGDADKLAHFLWALGQGYFLLGEYGDAHLLFEECVELGRGEPQGEAVRAGLFGLGRIAVIRGDAAAGEAAFAEARASAEEMADVDHLATSLVLLGDLARARGDLARARELLDASMRLRNADGTAVDEARALFFAARLAQAESREGDNGAGSIYAEALSVARRGGGLGFHDVRCLLGMGWASKASGHRTAAAGHYLDALATAQATGDSQATAQAFDGLSAIARLDGRLEEADSLARRGLEVHHGLGDVAGIASSLESIAALSADLERWPVAARLFAAAQALLDRAGYVRPAPDAVREEDLARVQEALGDEFAEAWEEGASLSVDDAVTYATKGRGARDRPAIGWDSLTPAERQVAKLVGEGLTNPEVGKRLFVSHRTVGHHLAHIYQKLGINSRTALIKELTRLEPV